MASYTSQRTTIHSLSGCLHHLPSIHVISTAAPAWTPDTVSEEMALGVRTLSIFFFVQGLRARTSEGRSHTWLRWSDWAARFNRPSHAQCASIKRRETLLFKDLEFPNPTKLAPCRFQLTSVTLSENSSSSFLENKAVSVKLMEIIIKLFSNM